MNESRTPAPPRTGGHPAQPTRATSAPCPDCSCGRCRANRTSPTATRALAEAILDRLLVDPPDVVAARREILLAEPLPEPVRIRGVQRWTVPAAAGRRVAS